MTLPLRGLPLSLVGREPYVASDYREQSGLQKRLRRAFARHTGE